MAPPQWRAQEPRVLFVPTGTASSRLAALAHSPAAEGTPYTAGEAHRKPSPRLPLARRPTRPLPAHSLATDRGCWPAAPLSRIPRPLSLPWLPRSLRSPTALLGAAGATGSAAVGRFAVHQRSLAHGSARFLDRLERCCASTQSSAGGQSQPFSDSPLDPDSQPRQSY